MKRIAVVVPIFNDWVSFFRLLDELNRCAAHWLGTVDIVAVDDGSTDPMGLPPAAELKNLSKVVILRLARNLGHQRAIAVGLVHVHQLSIYDDILVMDCDGDDRPEDVASLLSEAQKTPERVIVAQRTRRSEGIIFRRFYSAYKWLFWALTGQSIDFGNFCLIPRSHLERLVYMNELWNHLAGSIIRARVPLVRVRTSRGRRYAERSTMNFVSLVLHGLSAMSVFGDFLFVRLTVFCVMISLVTALAASTAVFLRLFTALAIPGWTTSVVGFAGIILLEALTLSLVATLMTLTNRSASAFIPALHALDFVRQIEKVKGDA